MGLWQHILGKTHCQSGLAFSISLWSLRMGRLPFFLSLGREGVIAVFSLRTNRWSVWSRSFSLHVFTVSLFYFFFSFFFSLDTQALQCMLISLQAELDIQRYLMKIESSQRVSTLPFLFSASNRTSPPAFLLSCVWHSNQPLNRAPVLSLVCTEPWFKSLKAKRLQHSETHGIF